MLAPTWGLGYRFDSPPEVDGAGAVETSAEAVGTGVKNAAKEVAAGVEKADGAGVASVKSASVTSASVTSVSVTSVSVAPESVSSVFRWWPGETTKPMARYQQSLAKLGGRSPELNGSSALEKVFHGPDTLIIASLAGVCRHVVSVGMRVKSDECCT